MEEFVCVAQNFTVSFWIKNTPTIGPVSKARLVHEDWHTVDLERNGFKLEIILPHPYVLTEFGCENPG